MTRELSKEEFLKVSGGWEQVAALYFKLSPDEVEKLEGSHCILTRVGFLDADDHSAVYYGFNERNGPLTVNDVKRILG